MCWDSLPYLTNVPSQHWGGKFDTGLNYIRARHLD